MRSITTEKLDHLLAELETKGIDLLLVNDSEMARTTHLQYLSGHPTDALLAITQSGETCLMPADVPLAEEHAEVDHILDLINFQYSAMNALADFVKKSVKTSSPVIGVLSNAPFQLVLNLQQYIPNCKIYQKPREIGFELAQLRATKTPLELDRLTDVAHLSNNLLKDIRRFAQNASDETENDLAFYVMKRMRELGADENAFPSLVANTDRSYQLHCHPYATNAPFNKPGLSIIDFGAKLNGYCSDITQPFAFGTISTEQQKMIDVSLKAYDAVMNMIDIDVPIHTIAETARDILEGAGYPMNYGLGHGLGLEEHDAPFLFPKPTDPKRLESWKEQRIQEGMVLAIEPGAYVKGEGGFRLENDIMIRNGKVEMLTEARIEYIS
ncbi:Xaa-Pro dipeptidase [Candidatus Lokiarchaeum ossiferum]|uniref:Xaa-Pro dipeptidase n=1 Tax=Candidatus Lokiarchaeum ossiferum TaxID=2951803 RepID=A0ABY6HX30_9ARCH|nr:Xaa-Pro dipeptidase [Candidatus Lokiarchaeum sp. B-35]